MPVFAPERGQPNPVPAVTDTKIVFTVRPEIAFSSSTVGTAAAIGGRIQWPATGVINALAVFNHVSSGNMDVGAYNCAAGTRTRLGSSGSTAMVGTNAWQVVTVSFGVTANESADLMVAVDNVTASFATSGGIGTALGTLPTGWGVIPQGGVPALCPFVSTGMFPLPASYLESALAANGVPPIIMARYA